jgi:hypothetical protein
MIFGFTHPAVYRIANGHHDITGSLLKADDANSLLFSAVSRQSSHSPLARSMRDGRRVLGSGSRACRPKSNEVKQFRLVLTDREASELLLRNLKRKREDGHFLIT